MVVSKTKKIARRRSIAIGLFIVCIISILSAVYWIIQKQNELSDKILRIENQAITLDVVAANASREKGLSGRSSLANDKGMLFDFSDGSDGRCFWMKDMQFDIDIIWLNREKEVVHVAGEVPANSYPQNFCSSDAPRYVLELASGRAKELNITNGTELKF